MVEYAIWHDEGINQANKEKNNTLKIKLNAQQMHKMEWIVIK